MRRQLIAAAHHLRPIIIIGNRGLTSSVLAEIDRALYDHELIKVRINAATKEDRLTLIQEMCEPLKAECLKLTGHIAILYRVSDKKKSK